MAVRATKAAKAATIKQPTSHVNVYLNALPPRDLKHVAGMLRGLAVSIAGFAVVSGKDNQSFAKKPRVKMSFQDPLAAKEFRDSAKRLLDKSLFTSIRVARVVRTI